METHSVYLNQVADLFKKIQAARIPVKIYNHSGQWSSHFFEVLEIKEIKDKAYQVTVLILFDPETADSTAIDVKSVNMVELKASFEVEGKVYRKFSVLKSK